MKKKILSILLISFSILLSSCSTLIDPHEHSWSKYYDDGDGNHTRTCLLDIEHTETKPHNFVEGRIVQAVEGNKCGLRKYTCKDCGYSEVRAIYPECDEGHTHKMDKNITSDLYLYEKRSEYSSIYYKSCSCGAYGDDDYLFEHNILNNQYSQIDYVITDKSNYIDLGLDINNNYSYSFNNQNNQSRLLSGYTEVNYIETTGNQIIDTGVKDDLDVTVDLHMSTTSDAREYWYGSMQNEHMAYNGLWWLESFEYNYINIGREPSNEVTMTQYLSGSNNVITINNVTTTAPIGTVVPEGNLYIFGCNNGTRFYGEGLRCYYFKIYKDNDMIRNFVPAIRNYDNASGLYDLCQNRFYISEDNTNFKTGEEVMYQLTSRLPSGYSELEYIESTGTQYIDTEYKFSTSDEFELVITPLDEKLQCGGGLYSEDGGELYLGYRRWLSHKNNNLVMSNSGYLWESSELGSKKTILYEDKNVYVNDELKTTIVEDYSTNYNFYLFCLNRAGTPLEMSNTRFYRFKIYSDGVLIHDYVPAKNIFGNVGIYDLIENVFHANLGTGDFIEGNVISSNFSSRLPSGYQEVEYIKTDGTQYIDLEYEINGGVYCEYKASWQESGYIVGSHAVSDPYNRNTCYLHMSMHMEFGYGNLCPHSDASFLFNKAYNVEFNTFNNNAYCQVDGEILTFNQESYFSNENITGHLYLFTTDYHLNPYNNLTKGSLYSCIIKDCNGDLIFNLIPCINNNGVAGVYNTVNNKFYTSQVGNAFETGNVTTNLYSSRLPSGYKELEYIESTGTQYIDTGISLSPNIRSEIVFDAQPSNGWGKLYGYSQSGYGPYALYMQNSELKYYYQDPNGTEWSSLGNVGNKCTKVLTSTFANSYSGNIYINDLNPSLTEYERPSVKWYSVKIYSDDILVRNFVPAKNSYDEVGLYDLITNTFYSNDGTGEFIAGNYLYNSINAGSLFYYDLDYTIPDKYKELSSITTSSSYINTECYINPTTRLELNFSLNDNNDSTILYVNDNFNVRVEDSVLKVKILDTTLSSLELKINQIYHLVLGSSLSYTPNTNSSYLNYLLPSLLSNNTDNIYLLNNSEGNSENGPITIYSFKVYENNTLSNSFIPSYKISNDVIGLYDIKNYKFIPFLENEEVIKGINDNTSSLIDTEIKDIILPDQYIKKDYIESTGKQYIDTGIEYDANTHLKFDIEISYLDTTTKDEFMGFCSDMWYIYGRNSSNYFVGSPNLLLSNNVIYGTSVEFYQGSATYSYQGKTYNKEVYSLIDTTNNPTFTLFTTFDKRNDITSYTNNCRIYSIRVYEDECLIKYYVPCTEKNTFRNGLYDVINNEFISSSTPYNLLSGYSSLVNANLNSTNLLYRIYNESISCDNGLINNVTIYDSNNSVYMNLIPVIRNSDSTIGLYDTINNTFYPLNSNIDKGEILGHNFDEGVIIQNPTYNQQGITKYTCTLCGEELYEYTDKLSYKIEYDKDANLLIKTYISNNDNEYMTSDTVYSRNIYTYNYSKVDSFVKFVVEDTSLSVCASSGYLQKLDDTTYLLTDISEDCIIYIR